MHKLSITFFFIFIHLFLFSQDTVISRKWGYKGYSGGMFIHLGYVQSPHFTVFDSQGNEIKEQIKGLVYGLGGKVSIFLNKYFRIGGEGYVTYCKYGANKNNYNIGWGGINLDLLYPVKRWAPFIGITIGGGNSTNLIFIEKPPNNKNVIPIIYYKQILYIIDTAIGVEFFTSNKISILFKLDYMLNIYKTSHVYPSGPRFYIGVHFYHKKN